MEKRVRVSGPNAWPKRHGKSAMKAWWSIPSSTRSSPSQMRNRGEIWLANLNPPHGTEPGKTRPVLIVQAQALLDAEHPSTLVVPLTTNVVADAGPLRIAVLAIRS